MPVAGVFALQIVTTSVPNLLANRADGPHISVIIKSCRHLVLGLRQSEQDPPPIGDSTSSHSFAVIDRHLIIAGHCAISASLPDTQQRGINCAGFKCVSHQIAIRWQPEQ
jgi:hypothetical protein